MLDRTKKVKTQWGNYVRSFASLSDDEINNFVGYCSETAKIAEDICGKQCFLAYGALLGLERSGKLIPHDFDIDIAINCGVSSKDEVAEICRKLIVGFIEAGFEVKGKSFGQFFVLPSTEIKPRYKVEFFASWVEDDKFYLYFALPGINIVESLFPLKNIVLEGHGFYAPKEPSALLTATYGSNWRVPDPNFKYNMTGPRWRPFTTYFFGRHRKQWDDYYTEDAVSGDFAGSGYEELHSVIGLEELALSKVIDIGCGGGALSLASRGLSVTAVDISSVVIEQIDSLANKNGISNLSTSLLNIYDIPDCEIFLNENRCKFDIVIASNLLDHLSLVGETAFFPSSFSSCYR